MRVRGQKLFALTTRKRPTLSL